MAPRYKSIWDNKITIHQTIREDTNFVMLEIAKDRGIPKSQVVELLVTQSPDFKKKIAKMREEGFLD